MRTTGFFANGTRRANRVPQHRPVQLAPRKNAGFIYEPAYLVWEQNAELKIVVIEDVFPEFTEEHRHAIWPDEFPGLALENAAVIETSLWMHFDPSAVREDRIAPDAPERVVNHDVVPIDTRMSTSSG